MGTVSNEGVEKVKVARPRSSPRTEVAATDRQHGAGGHEVAHMRNWMECVARASSRTRHRGRLQHAVALIMSNASLRTGRKATFDMKARQVLAGGKALPRLREERRPLVLLRGGAKHAHEPQDLHGRWPLPAPVSGAGLARAE
jgi:hypothetical protein